MPANEAIVISTPEGIEAYRRLAIVHALALEVNTGLTNSRGSVRALANSLSGSKAKTKKAALRDYCAWLTSVMPDWQPSRSVKRALS